MKGWMCHRFGRPGFIAAVCGLLGAGCFVPALWSGRLADDYVLEQTVQRVRGIGWVFSHNDLGQAPGAGHFYRPVWVLWNRLLYDVSHGPLVAHLGNAVLFAVLCAEVVALVWRLTRSAPRSWAAGLLFAVFPSHGESVAWISGNTDLLAGVWMLAALLLGVRVSARARREVAVFVLSAVAMLTKEIAFVLPMLLALVAWAAPRLDAGDAVDAAAKADGSRGWRSARWRPAWSALLAAAGVFIVRLIVVGGAGGYGPGFTVKRSAGSAVSFVLGALSAPQVPLIRHPVWLQLPGAFLGLGVLALVRLLRGGDRPRIRLALAGVAWFVVAILPVLNQPLDLNTRNGDRLLLVPSVGVVLALCAVLDLRRAATRIALTIVVLLCGVSCLANAFQWRDAGVESTRLIAEADALATRPGPIVFLSFPTDLGAAHLFPDALATALQESGRPGAEVITCVPTHPWHLRQGQTRFVPLKGGAWLGRTTPVDPFAVGVLSASSVSAGLGCGTLPAPHSASAGLGTRLAFDAKPLTAAAPDNVLVFDGANFLRADPMPLAH